MFSFFIKKNNNWLDTLKSIQKIITHEVLEISDEKNLTYTLKVFDEQSKSTTEKVSFNADQIKALVKIFPHIVSKVPNNFHLIKSLLKFSDKKTKELILEKILLRHTLEIHNRYHDLRRVNLNYRLHCTVADFPKLRDALLFCYDNGLKKTKYNYYHYVDVSIQTLRDLDKETFAKLDKLEINDRSVHEGYNDELLEYYTLPAKDRETLYCLFDTKNSGKFDPKKLDELYEALGLESISRVLPKIIFYTSRLGQKEFFDWIKDHPDHPITNSITKNQLILGLGLALSEGHFEVAKLIFEFPNMTKKLTFIFTGHDFNYDWIVRHFANSFVYDKTTYQSEYNKLKDFLGLMRGAIGVSLVKDLKLAAIASNNIAWLDVLNEKKLTCDFPEWYLPLVKRPLSFKDLWDWSVKYNKNIFEGCLLNFYKDHEKTRQLICIFDLEAENSSWAKESILKLLLLFNGDFAKIEKFINCYVDSTHDRPFNKLFDFPLPKNTMSEPWPTLAFEIGPETLPYIAHEEKLSAHPEWPEFNRMLQKEPITKTFVLERLEKFSADSATLTVSI